MLGKTAVASLGVADSIEGEVTAFDQESGSVEITTTDGDVYKGFEYQLEDVFDSPIPRKSNII